MTSMQSFNQESTIDPSVAILSSSIDNNIVPQFQLQTDLLGDELMLADPLEPLQADPCTQSLQASPQSHSDSNVKEQEKDSIATLESLQDLEGKQATPAPNQENGSFFGDYGWKTGFIIAAVIIVNIVFLALVKCIGFKASGIAAGSIAAGLMSTYGGTVAVGSLCSVLQSIGAAGLSLAGTIVLSTFGVFLGGAGVKILENEGDDQRNTTNESKPL